MTIYDCTDIKATLSGLVDGEVDTARRHLAERHLAGCAACRALLSEAEALDELIVADANSVVGAGAGLPEGFMQGVLSRTVYARMYEQAGWNWTSWVGWVAAAACLMLAVSLLFLDRARRGSSSGGELVQGPRGHAPLVEGHLAFADSQALRSWTWDGEVRPETLLASNVRTVALPDSPGDHQDLGHRISQATSNNAKQEPRDAAGSMAAAASPAPSPEDRLTLDSLALVLQMLAESDLGGFADVERVRQIAVYDELPERLALLRPRLAPADRAAVMAAEAVILRIINGPLSLADLRMLHDTAGSMGLARQISAIGAGGAATSL